MIATKNPGKYIEILEGLRGLPFEFVFLKDLRLEDSDFCEDGETFEENARKKAKYFFEKTGLLTFAEDSGLLVDALKGELGVRTRRWGAGEKASDREWIDFFMKRMEKEKNRAAKFVCDACLFGEGVDEIFVGETWGVITEEIMCPIKKGIPLSSCFMPEGSDKVYAALSDEGKNKISHRGKALAKVRARLQELIR